MCCWCWAQCRDLNPHVSSPKERACEGGEWLLLGPPGLQALGLAARVPWLCGSQHAG